MKLPLPVKMTLVLVIITSFSGFILSFVWNMSVDQIKENEQKNIVNALNSLNPTTAEYKIVNKCNSKIYQCYDQNKKHIANFFVAEGNGFQALIKVAVSVDSSWQKLIGIQVLEQSETPGLGSKITNESWTGYFKNLVLQNNPPITCLKGESDRAKGQISAITGATISSRAVTNLVNKQILKLKKAGL